MYLDDHLISVLVFRYDLLCIEGIARALRVFLKKDEAPEYTLAYPPGGDSKLLTVTVGPEVRLSPPPTGTTHIYLQSPRKDEGNQTSLRMRDPA